MEDIHRHNNPPRTRRERRKAQHKSHASGKCRPRNWHRKLRRNSKTSRIVRAKTLRQRSK